MIYIYIYYLSGTDQSSGGELFCVGDSSLSKSIRCYDCIFLLIC